MTPEEIISLWLGRLALAALAALALLLFYRWLWCRLGMHAWQDVVDWPSNRLVERRCLACPAEAHPWYCPSCGSAWKGWHLDNCTLDADFEGLFEEVTA